MKKIKTTRFLLIILCILMSFSADAYASSYSFHFEPPFVGSIQHAPASRADGAFTPYVQPSGTTNATTYVLTISDWNSTQSVSDFRTDITSGRAYFTYDTGYGGYGQYYKLTAYPSYYDFQEYYAAGSWKP